MFTNSHLRDFHMTTQELVVVKKTKNRKKDIDNVVRARTGLLPDEVKIMHSKAHKAGEAQPGELCQLLRGSFSVFCSFTDVN